MHNKFRANFVQFMEKIDIFGLAVSFRIAQEKNHKTKIGGLFTIALSSILLYQLCNLIMFVVDQNSPNVVQQQNYVYQPELFSINPKTFSFAFGMQNSVGVHFMDETIYTVTAQQQINTRVLNETTGTYSLVTVFNQIAVSRCTSDNFQIDDVKSYFMAQPINILYCFSLNQPSLSVEGEFSALVFKQINIQILECTGSNCTDSLIRSQKLADARLAIYTSDNIIQMTDKTKPFQVIGKNLFWIYSTMLEYEVRYNLINNYINTDKGVLFNDIVQQRVVNYSSDREQIYGRTTPRMFNFYFVYEKNKEVVYYRNYMKLDQAFSQVGGMFNVFLAIGCFFCRPISQLELNRKLLNTIFDIDTKDFEEIEGSDDEKAAQKKSKNHKRKSLKGNQPPMSPNINSRSGICNSQFMPNSPVGAQSEFHIIHRPLSPSFKEQSGNSPQLNAGASQLEVEKDHRKLKFNFCEYFASFFKVGQRKFDYKAKIIDYGTDIIYSHIDIFNVVQKLLEVEKLKNLLLNEHQLKLFDYLPKPTLKPSEIVNSLTQIQEKNDFIPSRNYRASFISKSTTNEQTPNQQQQQTDFLVTAQKTHQEKTDDALKAFNVISTFSKKSKIDQKLISMLDSHFLNKFKQAYPNYTHHKRQYLDSCSPTQLNTMKELNDRDDTIKEVLESSSPQHIFLKGNNEFTLFNLTDSNAKQAESNTAERLQQYFKSKIKRKTLSKQQSQLELSQSETLSDAPNSTQKYTFKSNKCELNKDLKEV